MVFSLASESNYDLLYGCERESHKEHGSDNDQDVRKNIEENAEVAVVVEHF